MDIMVIEMNPDKAAHASALNTLVGIQQFVMERHFTASYAGAILGRQHDNGLFFAEIDFLLKNGYLASDGSGPNRMHLTRKGWQYDAPNENVFH